MPIYTVTFPFVASSPPLFSLSQDYSASKNFGRVCKWNGRKCFRGSKSFSHPRFIVFPAPLGFSSVNLAQFSSFNRFASAFSSPSRVPSISASSASCSDDVGAAPDAGLHNLDVRIQGEDQGWVTYPAPLSILPLSLSICRYSSMDIVGNWCPGPKTWA